MAEKIAAVAGATGLVGRELVNVLLGDPGYRQVVVLGRRALAQSHPKLVQHVVDFDRLPDYETYVQGAAEVFCCLGTTIKKAGSQAAFRRVDYDYPLALAQLAKAAGVQQFLIVTAMAANETSSVFYNRVKGEVEQAIARVGLPGLHICRPSLLLGERDEVRPGEQAAALLMPLLSWALVGRLARYRAIAGRTVARAMHAIAKRGATGTHIYESDDLQRLGSARG